MRTAQCPLGYRKSNKKPNAKMHGIKQKGRTRSEVKMKYSELKEYFMAFHREEISKTELGFAIAMWQRHGARL
jgi:hypothetical protein